MSDISQHQKISLYQLVPLSFMLDLVRLLNGIVTRWVINDSKPYLNIFQYGSLKGCSTVHCRFYILDQIVEELTHMAAIIPCQWLI